MLTKVGKKRLIFIENRSIYLPKQFSVGVAMVGIENVLLRKHYQCHI